MDLESYYHNTYSSSNSNETTSNILISIVALSFDENIGQISEGFYPDNSLESSSIKSITCLGIPESTLPKEEGEIKYIFKIRSNYKIPFQCSSILDQKFYFCYSIFLQKKSIKSKRGYSQKSLVLVSEQYFGDIYYNLLAEVGQFYFNDKINISVKNKLKKIYHEFDFITSHLVLDKAIENIKRMSLKYLANEKPLIESYNGSQENSTNSSSNGQSNNNSLNEEISKEKKVCILKEMKYILPSNNNFIQNLSMFFVSKIWNLWELVITETPIIVSSECASKSSQNVMILQSLIYPLKYCGDIRPYLTIYDTDFKEYKDSKELKQTNSPIIGIINPYLLKVLDQYPLVLHFDDYFYSENFMENLTKITFNNKDQFKALKQNKKLLEFPSFCLKQKKYFYLKSNKNLITTIFDILEKEGEKGLAKANMFLRMQLTELTKDFLSIFDDYFFIYEKDSIRRLSLIKKNYSIFEIFNIDKFISFINDPNYNPIFNLKYLKDKRKLVEFYKQFVQTKLFNGYLKTVLKKIKEEYN